MKESNRRGINLAILSVVEGTLEQRLPRSPARQRKHRRTKRSIEGDLIKRCPACGRRTKELKRAACCGQMICAGGTRACRHERFTLCGLHHGEGHPGSWKTCARCRRSFETEIYVYYGTNKYNFEKLENPPAYEPKHCLGCGRVIVLGEDAYEHSREGYRCVACWED